MAFNTIILDQNMLIPNKEYLTQSTNDDISFKKHTINFYKSLCQSKKELEDFHSVSQPIHFTFDHKCVPMFN